VLRGTAQVPFNKDPKATQKPPLASQAVTTPVKLKVYNSVADVTLGTPMLTLKGGQDVEIIVRINRLNDYKGEYKVTLVPPQGFQGVTAAEVTIPANANEGKLMLKCAANAAPATNPNVVVRVSATVEKVVLNSEAKVGVTVVK
jgi:citrate lyase beta subunit